ncbi:hypothetical protein D9M69_664000 [compost metagenome]
MFGIAACKRKNKGKGTLCRYLQPEVTRVICSNTFLTPQYGYGNMCQRVLIFIHYPARYKSCFLLPPGGDGQEQEKTQQQF